MAEKNKKIATASKRDSHKLVIGRKTKRGNIKGHIILQSISPIGKS